MSTSKPASVTLTGDIEHDCQCAAVGSCPLYRRHQSQRSLDICRGFDGDGRSVLTPEKRLKYRRAWLEEIEPGLGDEVAGITKAVGVPTCGGCQQRREVLNQLPPQHWLTRLGRFLLAPFRRVPAPVEVQLPERSFEPFTVTTLDVRAGQLVEQPAGEAFEVRELRPLIGATLKHLESDPDPFGLRTTDSIQFAEGWFDAVGEGKDFLRCVTPDGIVETDTREGARALLAPAGQPDSTPPAETLNSQPSTLGRLHPIPPHVTRFAVGITTAARKEFTLPQTVKSLIEAGFDEVTIFAEPHAPTRMPFKGGEHLVVRRPETVAPLLPQITPKPDTPEPGLFGCWQNYLQTIADLLHLYPAAEAIIVAQDDITLAPGTREFLESDLWPAAACGLVSLYTPRTETPDGATGCRRRRDLGKTGACLNVFPRHVAEQLLEHPIAQDWRGNHRGANAEPVPWLKKAVDTATGDILRELKLPAYSYTPSLVDHFAQHSAVGHGGNEGKRNARSPVRQNVLELWHERKAFPPVRYSAAGRRQYPQLGRKDRPRISVVVPFVDQAELTGRCLEHLAAQDWPLDVLLVSNGSTLAAFDEVRAVAAELFAPLYSNGEHRSGDSTVEMIKWRENRGFTAAVNEGQSRAVEAGQPLLMLNNDCRLGPSCLERLYRALMVERTIAAVGPLTDDTGHQSLHQRGKKHKQRRRQAGLDESIAVKGRDLHSLERQLQKNTTSRENMLAFFCTLFRPEALQKVGPQPAEFVDGLGGDDVWCAAARRRNFRLELVHDAFAAHDHGTTFRSLGIDRSAASAAAVRKMRAKPPQLKLEQPAATPAQTPKRLAVICCHFNPAGFEAPVANLERFLDGMKRQGAEVYLEHAVFNSTNSVEHRAVLGTARRALDEEISRNGFNCDNLARQTLWQKETLLNLAAKRLPAEVDAVAWLDADLELPDGWIERTLEQLGRFAVVQLFETALQEMPDGRRVPFDKPSAGSVAHELEELRLDRVHPGFAWAMRREEFEACGGLLDSMITGGGDGLIASAFAGKPLTRGVLNRLSPEWLRSVQRYQQTAAGIVGGSFGCVPQTITHFWHGTRTDRRYLERWSYLTRGHYDPATDIEVAECGLLQWTDHAMTKKRAMVEAVAGYFDLRQEDAAA